MHIVIFSGGTVKQSSLLDAYVRQGNFFIAADSGAEIADLLGIIPDVIIGDFDSISVPLAKKLQKKGSYLVSYPMEKNETDTELALQYAVEHGATEITIVGGNAGDRLDHIVANMLLAAVSPIPVKFINGNQVSWVIKGPVNSKIQGQEGELLSLIPLAGDVEGITLENFQYPLTNEVLPFGKPRGISNVFTKKTATVSVQKGMLLVVHTYN